MSVGGNDARTYQRSAGSTVAGAPAAATASLASAAANLNLLVAAGAPTISFLGLDTANAPETNFAPDPAGARAIRSAFSDVFSDGMKDLLAGYADDGVIVHYLDLNLILERVSEDLGAYGLTGLACPAFPAPAGPAAPPGDLTCVLSSAAAAQYLFYGDQLHPTSAASAIIARYVAAQTYAPLTLQAPVSLGVDISRQFGRTLTSRVDLARGNAPAEGVRIFAVGDFISNDIDETLSNFSYENDGVGATLGAESNFGAAMGGVALNYSRSKSDFAIDASRNRVTSWQIGAYGGFASGGLFAQGHAAYGKDEHRIRRAGVIDNLSARPDGTHYSVGAKAGYLIGFDGLIAGLRAGPVIAFDHAQAKVEDYSEDGDAALSLSVSEQTLKSTTGQLGIEGRLSLIEGVRSFTTLTAEREFGKDGRTILFAQNSAPEIVNQWNVVREGGTYGRLSSGASFDLWQGATLNTAISSTFGRKDGREFGLQLGFNMGF
ncbi:autotransporter domain-containing protein [Sphingomonas lutea]|uniref:Autotransporter domain-containing protein n=1 Tax=Sphingomonas lutea TaxID=1045317 RepID=A0A7G9SK13_9SPHN|nr:autotransporter domain-containing protein [Sphingomonas lutea]QNN68188.1 autotransporter domain-containing protein [Sphingomonas lutea]